MIKNDKFEYKNAFGIVNPWPGDMSAESEVLARVKKAADDIGLNCVMLSNFGHILDENQKQTKNFVKENDLDFIISTHYETPKIMDSFYYHTLWNPPEIPLNLEYYTERVTNQYIMNDDFLIYDFGGMSNHLKSMLINKPRTLEGASTLVASFPESAIIEPKLKNPKLFYCGMNWERVVHNSSRHEGLFKLLDETGNVKFFGPDKNPAWGNIAPWEGYKSYQYPIPFDGFSILKEINECGITLVLSSDIHRRAGAATNRTYEACAGGSVIISDNNPFMQHYFKDAALFINYNKKNPKDTFSQIMEKYEWIMNNKDEALDLAKKSQAIFKEKFTLNKQLKDIYSNHKNRYTTISKDMFSKNSEKKVLITFVLGEKSTEEALELVKNAIINQEKQIYLNITLAIACDKSIYKEVKDYCDRQNSNIIVFQMELFDNNGSRIVTDGQAIRFIQKNIDHDYFINTFTNEVWFSDHITSLVRCLEDDSNISCAYSGRIHEDIYGYRRIDLFDRLSIEKVYNLYSLPCAGQIMFRNYGHDIIPDYLFDCIDGSEHYLYYLMYTLKYEMKAKFSARMTLVYSNNLKEKIFTVMNYHMQRRFIQDLVRFYLPPKCENMELDELSNLKLQVSSKSLSYFPIKLWIITRYYQYRLRKQKTDSKSYKKLKDKYEASMRKLDEFWRGICI